MRLVFLLVAIGLFLWSAAVLADWASWGTPAVMGNLGLASFAASFIPFHDYVERYRH